MRYTKLMAALLATLALSGNAMADADADALKAKGFVVEKAAVRMPEGPLKVVGESQVTVSLHTDVTATITVAVVGEN